MPGLSLGIGGSAGAYGGQSSRQDGVVFMSPITGDMTSASQSPIDHPASWVIIGAFAVMVVIYAHWHVY